MSLGRIRSELGWRYNLASEGFFYWRACRNWRAVWRCRVGDAPLEQIDLRNGLQLAIRTQDAQFVALPLLLEVWRDHSYLKFFAGQPKVVVDVGAHLGFFALYAARRWSRAHVVALEPNPDNFKLLEENIEKNQAWQVKPYALAASNFNGQAELIQATQSDAHSLFVGSAATRETLPRITVATINLEGLLALTPHIKIDLLKVDCEGAEYDLFRNQSARLKSSIGHIACEYHEWSGYRKEELLGLFASAGFDTRYQQARHLPTGMIWAHNRSWS